MSEHVSSTHKAEVTRIKNLTKVEGTDFLSSCNAFGYECIVRTENWKENDLCVYVPPDSLVDVTRPEFEFLAKDAKSDGFARVKARKVKGVRSFGILIPAPPGFAEGQDTASYYGIGHYEPPLPGIKTSTGVPLGGDNCSGPSVYTPKYDLESGRRYSEQVFTPGESVIVTEKIHGANGKYCFCDGKMYCGSRNSWKKQFSSYEHVTADWLRAQGTPEEKIQGVLDKVKKIPPASNIWWLALEATPTLRKFCEDNPELIVFGEVYGYVSDLRYGHAVNEYSFAAFDIMESGKYWDWERAYRALRMAGVPTVPIFNDLLEVYPEKIVPIPYDFERICDMAEGNSLIHNANHVREGVVVRPFSERSHPEIGRAVHKWVGAGYLERSKGK